MKVQVVYTFDLVVLRKRYGLDKLVREMEAEDMRAKQSGVRAAADRVSTDGCRDIREQFAAAESAPAPQPTPLIDCKQDIRNAFPEVTLPFDAPEVDSPVEEEVVTEVGAMEEVPPSGSGADESEEGEAQQDSPISQTRLKWRREESEESITLRHGEIVAALPPTFKSAGIIPYNKDGFWLGLERRGGTTDTWSDFGGKPEAGENAWETAFRECKEEAGIDLSDVHLCRPPNLPSRVRHAERDLLGRDGRGITRGCAPEHGRVPPIPVVARAADRAPEVRPGLTAQEGDGGARVWGLEAQAVQVSQKRKRG